MFFWSDKNGVVGSKLSFKYMYVLPQTPRAWGGGGYSPGPPTRALSWNSWGTLSGPQTPLLLTPPPNPKSWIRPWYVYGPNTRMIWNIYIILPLHKSARIHIYDYV
jgi:hypothetical protein